MEGEGGKRSEERENEGGTDDTSPSTITANT